MICLLGKYLSPAAVVICALRVNILTTIQYTEICKLIQVKIKSTLFSFKLLAIRD